jgi:hypothetical protein
MAGEGCLCLSAGARLTYRFTNTEAGRTLRSYWTDACGGCAIEGECTTGKERRIRRWEHESILERVQMRLDDDPDKIPLRSRTVEHPFGTIKAWMGATHFKMKTLKHVKTKTLKHVATEMALYVLACNLKRVMTILGVPPEVLTQPLCKPVLLRDQMRSTAALQKGHGREV